MKITIPGVFTVDLRLGGDNIRQLLTPGSTREGRTANYTAGRLSGILFLPDDGIPGEILVTSKKVQVPDNIQYAINLGKPVDLASQHIDASLASWLKYPGASAHSDTTRLRDLAETIQASWPNSFTYLQEDRGRGLAGLRSPQIGALHAILAHWSVSEEAATVVMPTGTGKTETMLSVLISVSCQKVLVVVPTDALRTQISEKFVTLGILKQSGIVHPDAKYPLVGAMKHKPRNAEELDRFFESCNIVVTTSQIAGQCTPALQERFAVQCTHLFIDEAHHVEARTWKTLKDHFKARRILQFTATPFREDDKVLEGKIIYRYPLRKAQEEGFFTPIHFKQVVEFDRSNADRAIASAAIDALQSDATGKHILMARAGTVRRAEIVYKLYEQHTQFDPVQLHTGIGQALREKNRQKIISGASRIVVCVDMLGEGFDLPELKIAAFHDIRKSLAVTLQIAGRFTRGRSDLGNATFIANVGDVDVRDELQKLYTQDPDWNALLPELNEQIIGEQLEVRELLDGFNQFPTDIPLRAIKPATSTVVYRTRCSAWTPQNFAKGLGPADSYARVEHFTNPAANTLVIVTAQRMPIEWLELEDVFTWDWQLYVLIWDADTKLLYINSSGNKGVFKRLAEAVAGDGVELIREPLVYRCFAGINRLRLTNVGLTEQIARLISYTGRMGADVEPALSQAQKRNTRRAVLFGSGFENGIRTTVGASRRGRLWSFRRVRLNQLISWCKGVGVKLLDDRIDPEQVLKGTLQSQVVSVRPPIMPIGIDWPPELYREIESAFSLYFDEGRQWPFYETSIELVAPSLANDLAFQLSCGGDSVEFRLELLEENDVKDYRFHVVNNREASIVHRSSRDGLEEFFYENPPVIWFADGSSLEGNKLTRLRTEYPAFEPTRIVEGDWAGIDLKKESQGISKRNNSIQFRVIQWLVQAGEYEIVFDDDGSGEVADVVAIKTTTSGSQHTVEVSLYHCKYSSEPTPGGRIEDLYEVCGQAQKSVSWAYSQEKQVDLFAHLLRREPKRRDNREATRFEKGDRKTLLKIRDMSRVADIRMKVFIVQPGISKQRASTAQLELLAVTENYLLETYKIPLTIIGSG